MIQEVIGKLESDLEWREAELAVMKLAAASAPTASMRQKVLFRALWAMLYAHYEGFSVGAWGLYLDVIGRIGLRRSDLPRELSMLSLTDQIKLIKTRLSEADIYELYVYGFERTMEQTATFTEVLKSNSNLWPNLFRENCRRACLPHTQVDEHRVRLGILVARRNSIAHGEREYGGNLLEYQEFENAVFLVLHELAISVSDAVKVYCEKFPSQLELRL